MTAQTLSANSAGSAPSVHVWLTIDEAARTLGTSPELISCQLQLGELESRVNQDGVQEVLIALPPRTDTSGSAERVTVSIVTDIDEVAESSVQSPESMPAIATALAPLLQSMRRAQAEEVLGARRAARVAWAVAAVMILAVGAGMPVGVHEWTAVHAQVQNLSQALNQTHTAVGQIDAERESLRAQLVEAREAAVRAEGELAVERKVEDTLFKATLASHVVPKTDANTPALANGAD